MATLVKQIVDCIENAGLHKPAIVLNGSYLMHAGRRIYVEPIYAKQFQDLRCFVRVYDRNTHSSEEITVTGCVNYINATIQKAELFGVSTNLPNYLGDANIFADANFNLIFIESPLYTVASKLQDTSAGTTFLLNDVQSTVQETAAIKSAFFREALKNYCGLVYATGANKFIRSLIRQNKFYGINPMSFVPVFINYKHLYNPLNGTAMGVQDTLMYKKAVSTGRFVENNDISAYFLTHREICEALGMSRFARFTPYIWYNMFVGLLQPTNTDFPNKINKVVLWESEQQPPKGWKSRYSQMEFMEMVDAHKDVSSEEIAQYQVVNTLEAFINKEHNLLKNIGPHQLDKRENVGVANLYDIYSEARIQI